MSLLLLLLLLRMILPPSPRQPYSVPTALGPLECVPVTVRGLPVIGRVTIVEATAASQEMLVDRALDEEREDDNDNNSDDIYGAVLWPAASALAARLLRAMHDNRKDGVLPTTTTAAAPHSRSGRGHGSRLAGRGAGRGRARARHGLPGAAPAAAAVRGGAPEPAAP